MKLAALVILVFGFVGCEAHVRYESKPSDQAKHDGARRVMLEGNVSAIVSECRANPESTYLVSADSSWDIPVDCKRMIQEHGK